MESYYCPLVKFKLNQEPYGNFEEIVITKDIEIILIKDLPSLSPLSNFLIQNKIRQYEKQINYWLSINRGNIEIEVIINLFQLALWIIKPTELQVHFFHNLHKKLENQKGKNLFSRFTYIPNHIDYEFNYEDITKLKTIFPVIMKLYKKIRFKNLIVFNYHGCITNSWEAAYIQFSTTFESLLRHDTHISKTLRKKLKWGLTKKLSWAYAILTETDNEKRQLAVENFRDIYKIRSEILHGESFKDKFGKGEINLERLANCRDMLRKLWLAIFDSQEMIEKLSGDDKIRSKYLIKRAKAWMPQEENV